MATSAYPPPPAFYELYRNFPGPAPAPFREGEPPPGPDAPLVLPPPPPPPIEGQYIVFGGLHQTDISVPPLGIVELFEPGPDGSVDAAAALRRLNRELLFAFMDLVKCLAVSPSLYGRKVEAIGTLVRNMHFLLNSLRPQQGRARLVAVLEARVAARRQARTPTDSESTHALTPQSRAALESVGAARAAAGAARHAAVADLRGGGCPALADAAARAADAFCAEQGGAGAAMES